MKPRAAVIYYLPVQFTTMALLKTQSPGAGCKDGWLHKGNDLTFYSKLQRIAAIF